MPDIPRAGMRSSKDVPQLARHKSLVAAHWKFDEGVGTSVFDATGNNHTGTLNGGAARVPGRLPGQPAILFDGVNDTISVPNSPLIDMDAGQDFAVCAWIKSTQTPGVSAWQYVMSHHAAPGFGYQLALHDAQFSPLWFFEIVVGGVQIGQYGASDVADGNWHLLGGQRRCNQSGTAAIETWQDGALAATLNSTNQRSSGSTKNTNQLFMGGHPAGGSFYAGSLMGPRIFQRALEADEWMNIFKSGM